MITYFPKPYEDELIYSLLARWYQKSGFFSHRKAIEVLFVNRNSRPDIEFINELNEEVIDLLCRDMSMEDVIMEMTMFPYYGRFLNKEKRVNAFKALVSMKGNFNNLLSMPRNATDRYLRYCPLCCREDREEKGETYWKRVHQIQGISVCPYHGCKLLNSNVIINKDIRVIFRTAELEAVEENVVYGTEREIAYSLYLYKILTGRFLFEGETTIGDFLRNKCPDISFNKMYEDLVAYYKGTDILNYGITEEFHIPKLLQGIKFNPTDIAQLGFYLDIPVDELLSYGNANVGKIQREKRKISKKNKGVIHKIDYEKLDKEMLPRVRELINKYKGNEDICPKRITTTAITKELGLPQKRINFMVRCKEEIEKNYEEYSIFHAKKAIWAIKKLRREGREIFWYSIVDLTGISFQYKEKCLQRAMELADAETMEIINAL